jgi:uncharacterized protein (DUF58 family)
MDTDTSLSSRWRRSLAGVVNAALWPLRTLLRLTRDGAFFLVLALACAVAAASRRDQFANMLFLVALILFSLLCSALILGGASLRRLRLARRCQERLFAGDLANVALTVQNLARVPASGLVIVENLRPQDSEDDDAGASQRLIAPLSSARPPQGVRGAESFAMVVAGRGRERLQYALRVRRRGIYRFGRTALYTGFPFGFWRTEGRIEEPGRLTVYPRLGEIGPGLFLEVEQAQQRLRRFRPSREEEEFRGLREFRLGDHHKWIHWHSSAHHGDLLVREFERPLAQRVVMLLDTNLQRLGPQRLPAFELAISFAATAARELARRGSEVSCAMLPPRAPLQWITVSREYRNLDQLYELLAGLRPDNSRTLALAGPFIARASLRSAYVLVLGLGSLRLRADLGWLHSPDNVVKLLDVRGEEFRRLFRRAAPAAAARGEPEEDLEPLPGEADAEAVEEAAEEA